LLSYDFSGNLQELQKIISEAIENTLKGLLTPEVLVISFKQVTISAQAVAQVSFAKISIRTEISRIEIRVTLINMLHRI
jgi:transcriptional regulator with AAA-type ATPase domain